MTGPVEPKCRHCGDVFDPDLVHDTFLADYLDRIGQPHTGRRPPWTRHFCTEACRYADVARRGAAVTATMSQRRAARRAAARHEAGR